MLARFKRDAGQLWIELSLITKIFSSSSSPCKISAWVAFVVRISEKGKMIESRLHGRGGFARIIACTFTDQKFRLTLNTAQTQDSFPKRGVPIT